LVGQNAQELLRGGGGQLLEKGGSIVIGHVIQDRRDLFLPEPVQESLLRRQLEELKNVRSTAAREYPEDDRLVLNRKVADFSRYHRGLPPSEDLAQSREVLRTQCLTHVDRIDQFHVCLDLVSPRAQRTGYA